MDEHDKLKEENEALKELVKQLEEEINRLRNTLRNIPIRKKSVRRDSNDCYHWDY